MINREDNVTMLKYPNGSFVTEHADGTRITVVTNPRSNSSEVMCECPGFARIIYKLSQICRIEFPDESVVTCSCAGRYRVELNDEYCLIIEPNGMGHCTLQPESPFSFDFDHTGRNSLLVATSKTSDVEFSVSKVGAPAVSKKGYMPTHPAYSPRYFVKPLNGNAYQILSKSEMDLFFARIQNKLHTSIVKEPVSECQGEAVTVLEAVQERPPILPYKKGKLISQNLSSCFTPPKKNMPNNGTSKKPRFGIGVGKSLYIKTNECKISAKPVSSLSTLRYRKFMCFKPISDALREEIYGSLIHFIATRQQNQEAADRLLPVDTRDSLEKIAAGDLSARYLAKLSSEALALRFQESLQSKESQVFSEPIAKVPKKHGFTEKICDLKRDIEEAERLKLALRNHSVPPYFESREGQEFLRSLSPDMDAYASHLAHPKIQIQPSTQLEPASDHSFSSTPSTLHSASVMLPPIDIGSPQCDEMSEDVDTASLVYRPSRPTPDHAQGTYIHEHM